MEVKETDNNNNTNGVSEYNYSTAGSINVNTMIRYNRSMQNYLLITNPMVPPIPDIPSGDRGKLLLETHYKLVNGTKLPVSSTRYRYTKENSDTLWQILFNQGLSDFVSPGYMNEQVFMANLDTVSQGLRLLQQAHVVTPVETWNEQYKTPSAKKFYGGQINLAVNVTINYTKRNAETMQTPRGTVLKTTSVTTSVSFT